MAISFVCRLHSNGWHCWINKLARPGRVYNYAQLIVCETMRWIWRRLWFWRTPLETRCYFWQTCNCFDRKMVVRFVFMVSAPRSPCCALILGNLDILTHAWPCFPRDHLRCWRWHWKNGCFLCHVLDSICVCVLFPACGWSAANHSWRALLRQFFSFITCAPFQMHV